MRIDLKITPQWVSLADGAEIQMRPMTAAERIDVFNAHDPETGRIPGGVQERTVVACATDWSGVEDEAGQPIPFSQERLRTLLDMPQTSMIDVLELFGHLAQMSRLNGSVEPVEDEAGNSSSQP